MGNFFTRYLCYITEMYCDASQHTNSITDGISAQIQVVGAGINNTCSTGRKWGSTCAVYPVRATTTIVDEDHFVEGQACTIEKGCVGKSEMKLCHQAFGMECSTRCRAKFGAQSLLCETTRVNDWSFDCGCYTPQPYTPVHKKKL